MNDESYNVERLEEVRARIKGISLASKGNGDGMVLIKFGHLDQMTKR